MKAGAQGAVCEGPSGVVVSLETEVLWKHNRGRSYFCQESASKPCSGRFDRSGAIANGLCKRNKI